MKQLDIRDILRAVTFVKNCHKILQLPIISENFTKKKCAWEFSIISWWHVGYHCYLIKENKWSSKKVLDRLQKNVRQIQLDINSKILVSKSNRPKCFLFTEWSTRSCGGGVHIVTRMKFDFFSPPESETWRFIRKRNMTDLLLQFSTLTIQHYLWFTHAMFSIFKIIPVFQLIRPKRTRKKTTPLGSQIFHRSLMSLGACILNKLWNKFQKLPFQS